MRNAFAPLRRGILFCLLAAGSQIVAAQKSAGIRPYLKCGTYYVYQNFAYGKELARLNGGMDAYTFSTKHPSEVMSRKSSNMGETAAIQFYQHPGIYRQVRSVRLAGPGTHLTSKLKPLRYEAAYERMIAGSLLGYEACRPSP